MSFYRLRQWHKGCWAVTVVSQPVVIIELFFLFSENGKTALSFFDFPVSEPFLNF